MQSSLALGGDEVGATTGKTVDSWQQKISWSRLEGWHDLEIAFFLYYYSSRLRKEAQPTKTVDVNRFHVVLGVSH
jgi:hypothetical protein